MKKIDLHTHTVTSVSDTPFEFNLSKVVEYVDKLEISALAITNHNLFDEQQYFQISQALDIPVFPGIEVDLEGGHILVITEINDFEISNFNLKCKQVSDLIQTAEDDISLSEFKAIFQDLGKYLLIPHFDKKPSIKSEVIAELQPYIYAGEVASIPKFRRAYKDTENLVPVLFSDIRFKEELENFPTRQTYIDLETITLAGLKSCLEDRSKIALSENSGNDFFQATDDGLKLSTGLNIILGQRSSGKTITLDKIASSSGNAKYIKQFSLLNKDEEKFNEANQNRLSLAYDDYLGEFKKVVEKTLRIDRDQNHLEVEKYLDSLKKFARENEKKDLYSKCKLFEEDSYITEDISNLDKLIKSVITLIENSEYENVITKYVSTSNLRKLALELIDTAEKSIVENSQKDWVNTIVTDVKRELRIKTTGSYVEDIDLNKIALDEVRIEKFSDVVSSLKVDREIHLENLGKFSIKTSTKKIQSATDLQKIGKDKKPYSKAFAHYTISPYEYLLQLRELGVEDANLFKFFVKIESLTFNQDGFKVSGGERSEFNLIHEIQDATKYDILLIDEPESSFDNNFLNKEINTIIKHISSLMPVVVVTHNSTVGASIKPNYLAITEKKLEGDSFVYRTYTGYPSDKNLTSSDGTTIKNFEALLNCLEAGVSAYNDRKEKTYEILKD